MRLVGGVCLRVDADRASLCSVLLLEAPQHLEDLRLGTRVCASVQVFVVLVELLSHVALLSELLELLGQHELREHVHQDLRVSREVGVPDASSALSASVVLDFLERERLQLSKPLIHVASKW